jgi:uncharacterized delta-60 repeat protein
MGNPFILLTLFDRSSMICGYASTGPRLAKVTADGKMDSGFGEEGLVKLKFAYPGHQNGEAWIFDVLEIIDNNVPKFLLLLSIPEAGKRNFAVARLQSNGALDLTFGSGGKGYEIYAYFTSSTEVQSKRSAVTPDDGSRYNRGGEYGASVKVDGKFIVSFNIKGATSSSDSSWFFRLHPDGRLDVTFGDGGKLQFKHPGGLGRIVGLKPASEGKFIAAGNFLEDSVENGAGFVGRFFSNDARVDESFGDKQLKFPGYYQTPGLMEPGAGSSFLREVSVDALSGDVTSIGYQYKDGSSVGIVVRLRNDGTFDPAFNGGVLLKVEGRSGSGSAMSASLVDSDGLIYVAEERGGGMQRRVKSGDIDPAFGQGGYAVYPDAYYIVELTEQAVGKLLMLSSNENVHLDRLIV